MKNKMNTFHSLVLALSLIQGCSIAFAQVTNDSKAESHLESGQRKANELVQDTQKVSKKAVREIKDQTCEMVNGKMECVVKKAVNKAKTVTDEVKDKANDGSTK